MKINKEKIVGLAVFALILTAGISTAFADNVSSDVRKAEMAEQKAEMQEIFENGTYSDWVNLTNSNLEERIIRMREQHQEKSSQVTEENWDRFVEAHELMVAGDKEGARAIMEELGIERGGMGKAHKKGQQNRGNESN